MTGAQVARKLLDNMGLYDVTIEQTSGHLTDHYDPKAKKVRLSREVYSGSSLASLAIAAHETGHAEQHDTGYFFLTFRNNFFSYCSNREFIGDAVSSYRSCLWWNRKSLFLWI